MTRPVADPPRGGNPGTLRGRFVTDTRGTTAIEYALIAGLIFVVVAGSLRLFASKVSGVYTNIGNAISQN